MRNHPLVPVLAAMISVLSVLPARADTPEITIFYGANQTVGTPGVPQVWANVLGRVTTIDTVLSLGYSMNGGVEIPLNVGPDGRRLYFEGDFVVEIDIADLLTGPNTVEIHAVDLLGDENTVTVMLDYTPGNVWPLPFSIDWPSVTSRDEVIQVVDGIWEQVPGGMRLVDPSTSMAYDRVLAFGDMTWQDYEVEVVVTMNDFEPGNLGPTSGSATVGLSTSWQGHNTLVPGEQPNADWRPQGANLSYDFNFNLADEERLYIGLGRDTGPTFFTAPPSFQLELGTAYVFKLRTLRLSNDDTDYRAKVWEAGTPEPNDWLIRVVEEGDGQNVGSVILVAHHVDATFGDVSVVPIVDDGTGPVIENIVVDSFFDRAEVRWCTDEAATGVVQLGETAAYGLATVATNFGYEHVAVFEGLTFGQTYHFEIEAIDVWSNTTTTPDQTFTTSTPPASSLVTDEFCGSALRTEWTFVDPLSDTSLAFDGNQLIMSPDSAAAHDYFFTDTLPRIRQSLANTDFFVEVEFANPLVTGQAHGLLFEDATGSQAVRVDVTFQSETRLFVGRFQSLLLNDADNDPIDADTRWLRVLRSGDDWTVAHSVDGASWSVEPSFSWSMAVEFAGISTGNNSGTVHDNGIAAFRNLAAPIPPDSITITSQPEPAILCPGESAELSVMFTSALPTTIEWRRDGVPVAGATQSTLTTDLAGDYDVVLDDGCTSITSDLVLVGFTSCSEFLRGDANGDLGVDIGDAVALLNHLFLFGPLGCFDAADANDDGSNDIADAISILNFLFALGAPFPPPVDACGEDPTDDSLDCQANPCP